MGSSEGSVLAARASNFTNEQIFFLADSRRIGKFRKRRLQQIFQGPPQERQRQPPIGGQGPVGQGLLRVIGVLLREQNLPQALETADHLQLFDGCRFSELHTYLLMSLLKSKIFAPHKPPS